MAFRRKVLLNSRIIEPLKDLSLKLSTNNTFIYSKLWPTLRRSIKYFDFPFVSSEYWIIKTRLYDIHLTIWQRQPNNNTILSQSVMEILCFWSAHLTCMLNCKQSKDWINTRDVTWWSWFHHWKRRHTSRYHTEWRNSLLIKGVWKCCAEPYRLFNKYTIVVQRQYMLMLLSSITLNNYIRWFWGCA